MYYKICQGYVVENKISPNGGVISVCFESLY